jgi:hypothetical protein
MAIKLNPTRQIFRASSCIFNARIFFLITAQHQMTAVVLGEDD